MVKISWEIVSDYPNPDQDLVTREFYERLSAAIADLPEAFRTTIILRENRGHGL